MGKYTKKDEDTTSAQVHTVADDDEIKKFLDDPESADINSPPAIFYKSLRFGDKIVEIQKSYKREEK